MPSKKPLKSIPTKPTANIADIDKAGLRAKLEALRSKALSEGLVLMSSEEILKEKDLMRRR